MNTQDFLDHDINRRQFLGSSAANAAGAVAAGMVGVSLAAAGGREPVPTERLSVAIIGARSQGRTVAERLAAHPLADIAAVCDIDEAVLDETSRAVESVQHRPPRKVRDFRRLLDDGSIDAVVIAAPDHWHAPMTIRACQAGKDVYVESPAGHNMQEGEAMLAAARRHERIVQAGLQQRSGSHFQSAVDYVRSGKLGTVALARAWTVHRRRPIGHKPDVIAPKTVDYDLWLGPAQQRNFNHNRFHANWRWFWDYGGGELTNWGVHMLDVARLGLRVNWPHRVSASGGCHHFRDDQQTPDTLIATFEFDLPPHAAPQRDVVPMCRTIVWEHRQWSTRGLEGRSAAVAFYGDRGTLIVDRSGWKVYDTRQPTAADADEMLNAHLDDFIQAVCNRTQPAADIADARISSGLCHLGNMAYRERREVSIATAATSEFFGREYRREWAIDD